MTDRNWIGGHGANNVVDAENWSPAGTPQPGDGLTIVTGEMAFRNTALAGDELHTATGLFTGPITLDLNGGRG